MKIIPIIIATALVVCLGVAGYYYESDQVSEARHSETQLQSTVLDLNAKLAAEKAARAKAVADGEAAALEIARLRLAVDKSKADLDSANLARMAAEKKIAAQPVIATAPATPATSFMSAKPAAYSSYKALAENFSSYTQFLAILEGPEGNGSGFLAMLGSDAYLITNAHVLSGNDPIKITLMSGKPFVADSMRLADGFDLISLPNKGGATGLEVIGDVASSVSVGDDIVVLGNSMGAGVATLIKGKVTGIGPSLIEVDAPFVPGNSGSPIIHVKTGKVIGVATYSLITRQADGGIGHGEIAEERRFGYRLDTVAKWSPIDIKTFTDEGVVYHNVKLRTKDLIQLAKNLNGGTQVSYGQYYSDTNSLKDMVKDLEEKMSSTGRNPSYYTQALKDFLFFVSDYCVQDTSHLTLSNFSRYHRDLLVDEGKTRDLLVEYFKSVSDNVGQSVPH